MITSCCCGEATFVVWHMESLEQIRHRETPFLPSLGLVGLLVELETILQPR